LYFFDNGRINESNCLTKCLAKGDIVYIYIINIFLCREIRVFLGGFFFGFWSVFLCFGMEDVTGF